MPELATQGAMINYAEEGKGDPLVLVHGSWDERETWQQVVPLLIDEFRVITFDRRGHGRSRGAGPLDADVDDLAALIEHVGPPTNVAASSLGAVIALRLASRHGAYVRRGAPRSDDVRARRRRTDGPPGPVLLTGGHKSPPYFGEVLSVLEHALPGAERRQLQGAHLPHRTHPKRYAATLRDFAGRSASQRWR